MRRLDEPVLLFMLDIDHFKLVNDTHGHAAGDEVLRSVAKTMASSIREVDRAFRIGGEECIARARKAMEPAELLKAADAALYEAKANGRNRVVVASQNATASSPQEQ